MAEKVGYALNFANKIEIDITPSGPKRTWALVAEGVSSIEPSGNEEIAQDPYYSGKGMASSDVTGGQITLSVSGHRCYGDPAQDYVASVAYQYGEARKTHFRWAQPNGDKLIGECTLANISPGSELGDANAKGNFNYEIHLNGLPIFTKGGFKEMPSSVEITGDPLTVQVGATVQAEAQVEPESSSKEVIWEVDDDSVATVSSDGVVTGVSEGETTLTAYCAAKPSVNTQAKVTVTAGA